MKLMDRGLKVYCFYLAVLFFFRLFFILWMQDYWGRGTGWPDVELALWRGLCLSCQTAGVMTLMSLIPAALLHYLRPRWEMKAWSLINGLQLVLLSIFYVASFPYYRQFHANFNQMIFTGANDDLYALLVSFIVEFYLPVRLLGAFLLASVLWYCLRRLLQWNNPHPLTGFGLPARLAGRAVYVGLLYVVFLLSFYGGALSWENEVNWENAGVTKDNLLNEAILDNPQALHRAWTMNGRMLACYGLDFSPEEIQRLAAKLSHKPAESNNLDDYLTRETAGPQIARPRQIFFIISESLANWPLLPQYRSLGIGEELHKLIDREDSIYCPAMLPNGESTVSAVMGIVTGFADANLYLTTMPEAYSEPYSTASAPQMEELGYETNFWYAGPSTWEQIGAFTTAQGYQHFYSRGDIGQVPGSVWGCEDQYLYEKVLAATPTDKDSFNVILNASNHSPYDVDVVSKNYPMERVRTALPEEYRKDEDLLRKLGHYWYADREMGRFVTAIKEKYPDALVIIVGDHADRYNLDKTPNAYERYVVPFIITGSGIRKDMLPAGVAGSQIDIMPTLIELIAPKGYSYASLGQSLLRGNKRGVNYGWWITAKGLGHGHPPFKPELFDGTATTTADIGVDDEDMEDYVNGIWSISWWRAKYGPILDEKFLEGRVIPDNP